MINNHFKSISLQFDTLHKTYENFILIGDFNSETCEGSMKDFRCLYNLKNWVKNATCFKNPEHPTCIDLILTNKSSSFQHTSIIETGLSDFHRLTVTAMKINFQKQAPKILYCRNYNRFNDESFRIDLIQELSTQGFHNVQCNDFEDIIISALNRYAPLKKRYIIANNAPFMTKVLCKALMVRSRLRNKSLKPKTIESREAYKKQRNYCVALLRKAKKYYYVKLITDNKQFWKTVKPFFRDKNPANTKITLIEANEIISDSLECAEIMNNFFSDAALNLDVDRDLYTEVSNAFDPVTIAIDKYKHHPSIVKLNEENFPKSNFNFQYISE